MAIHVTRVYTRTGDAGTSKLVDGNTVPKTDARLVAYADCDEANSCLGIVCAIGAPPREIAVVIERIQNELFDVGADLGTPIIENPAWEPLRVTQEYVDRLEADCDRFNADLANLDSFILPGGTPAAALLHQARTVVRRAERSAWALYRRDPDTTSTLACMYLNRLSDLLFIFARVANPGGDIKWVPGGERGYAEQRRPAGVRRAKPEA
ncbi:MAG: cob(I)yrinic acid a,c-diamide adenosyltransferase [Nakamurella sp.]